MSDTLAEKLSKAAKPVVDYAKGKYQDAKTLYQQGRALTQPIDKGTIQTIQEKSAQINELKKQQDGPKAKPDSYKKGGKVKKGGMAKVHKGERVLTTKQSARFEKKGGFGKLYGK